MQTYLKRYLLTNSRVNTKLTAADFLALQIIYGNDEQAVASWNQFRNDGFDVDSLYLATGKDLLPLLCKRVSEFSPEDPWLGKIKGFSRYTWTKNQYFFNALKTLHSLYRENNIECAVFGDAALLLGYYKVVSMRPIQSLSLLVRPSDFELAKELGQQVELPDLSPHCKPGYRPLRVCKSMHEVLLEDGDGRLQSVQFAGHEFPVFDTPNLLLILLIDLYYFEISQSQWFIDMVFLLTACSKDDEIEYLMRKIKSLRMAAPVIQVWSFFRETARSVYFDVDSLKVAARFDAIAVQMDELAKRGMSRISAITSPK